MGKHPDSVVKIEMVVEVKTTNPNPKEVVARVSRELELMFGSDARIRRTEYIPEK